MFKSKKPDTEAPSKGPDPASSRRTIVGGPPPASRPSEASNQSSSPAPSQPAAPSASLPSSRNGSADSTTLGPNLLVEGSIAFTGTLVVNCRVRGSVCSEDRLVVGPNGDVQGDLDVGSVEISGRVQGDIRAKKAVRIQRGGHVLGDIETPTIAMEEGVVFEGRCTRSQPEPEDSPEPSEVVQPMANDTAPVA